MGASYDCLLHMPFLRAFAAARQVVAPGVYSVLVSAHMQLESWTL